MQVQYLYSNFASNYAIISGETARSHRKWRGETNVSEAVAPSIGALSEAGFPLARTNSVPTRQ